MKLKTMMLMSTIILILTACTEKPKDKFYIMQEGKYFVGDEISIKKEPFMLVSSQKGYSVVIAKEPIYNLADHKEIVKLNGTEGAWYPGELPFYQPSELLSDERACDVYFGYQGEGCQVFVKEKTRLGFRRHYAYTFAEYMIMEKKMKITKIGNKKVEDLASGKYYLYFFSSEDKMGEVARAQRVTRMRVNLN